jgi:hypothetical protein
VKYTRQWSHNVPAWVGVLVCKNSARLKGCRFVLSALLDTWYSLETIYIFMHIIEPNFCRSPLKIRHDCFVVALLACHAFFV